VHIIRDESTEEQDLFAADLQVSGDRIGARPTADAREQDVIQDPRLQILT
jgi:hypothetical protein